MFKTIWEEARFVETIQRLLPSLCCSYVTTEITIVPKAWEEHETEFQALVISWQKNNRRFSQKNHEQRVVSSEKIPTSSALELPKWQYSPPPPLETTILFCLFENVCRFFLNCHFREYPLASTCLGVLSTYFFL